MVNADAVAGWENNFAEQAGAWLKVAERIFGIQTYLNRMTLRLKIASLCIQIRRITGGQTDHPLDQINAINLFGHAVLNLQAGIHFKKVKLVAVGVVNELHGPGIAVTDAAQ